MPDDGELLTTEQVDQLLADVRELIAQFEASAIRPALKAFIIEHLRLIEQAIINYPVVGARPLIDTFTRVRRDLSERQEEIFQAEASTDDEVQNSLWWKLQDYGAKLYAMLAGLVKFEKLLKEGYDTYKGLLPPPSSQMPGSDDDIGGLPS